MGAFPDHAVDLTFACHGARCSWRDKVDDGRTFKTAEVKWREGNRLGCFRCDFDLCTHCVLVEIGVWDAAMEAGFVA